jgi:hypothetical protein
MLLAGYLTLGVLNLSGPLLISLEIPFIGWNGQSDSIAFDHWLPLQEADAIVINKPDRSLSLRFTPNCTRTPDLCGPEKLPKWANASANKVIAEAHLTSVSDELINGILTPDHSNTSPDWLSNNPHRMFAIDVVTWVLSYVNRLVSYAAYQKGQYNLIEISLDADNLHTVLLRFNAKAKVGHSEWMSWNPPGIGGVWRCTGYSNDREIRAEDWPKAKDYVSSTSRPHLVRELLARADFLKERGHERAALTEAVTALEVAIHEFAGQPNAQAAFGSNLATRMDVHSLKDQVKRLGLNCSVRYLLPVIFSEDKLSTEVLHGCADAIVQRQNVVHNGQRTVEAIKLTHFLKSIRALCEILEKYYAVNVPG